MHIKFCIGSKLCGRWIEIWGFWCIWARWQLYQQFQDSEGMSFLHTLAAYMLFAIPHKERYQNDSIYWSNGLNNKRWTTAFIRAGHVAINKHYQTVCAWRKPCNYDYSFLQTLFHFLSLPHTVKLRLLGTHVTNCHKNCLVPSSGIWASPCPPRDCI